MVVASLGGHFYFTNRWLKRPFMGFFVLFIAKFDFYTLI